MANVSSYTFEKDLLLSHFTPDNLGEAVFWVDADARIFQVNEMACKKHFVGCIIK